MATINIGEIVTTTLRNRSKQLSDNVLNHNSLFMVLNQKGNVRDADGGREIVEELEYAENGTAGWYTGYEVLDITPQEVFDAATYDWKQLAGNVSISGLEEMKNSGKNRIIPLLQKRITNLEKTLKNRVGTAVYSNGTTDPKAIGGLQLLVADDPTAASTIGGIAQATYTFWRNQYSAAAATSSGNIQARMNLMWLACVRGVDKPDVIPADSVMYTHYENALTQYQRFSGSENGALAKGGFSSLMYKTAEVVYDDQAPASHMYMLNTDYIYLRPHSDRKFVPLDDRNSINQDAKVIPVVWGGNMTCSNRSLQGVIIAS